MQNVEKSRDQNLEYHWVALPLKYLSAKPPKYQPQHATKKAIRWIVGSVQKAQIHWYANEISIKSKDIKRKCIIKS